MSEQSHPPPLLPRLLDQHPVYSEYIVHHLKMIITRTPKTGREKEGLQVTGSIANSSCCCCPTSGTGDNIPYWATDIDKRRSDQAHTEFDLEGPTQQLLVFFCLNSPISFVQHVISPWYVSLLKLRVHFYRQERAQFPKALMCALGKRSLCIMCSVHGRWGKVVCNW